MTPENLIAKSVYLDVEDVLRLIIRKGHIVMLFNCCSNSFNFILFNKGVLMYLKWTNLNGDCDGGYLEPSPEKAFSLRHAYINFLIRKFPIKWFRKISQTGNQPNISCYKSLITSNYIIYTIFLIESIYLNI